MSHELYMQRCIQLTELGAGFVAPNPMVGAVLVFKDRIIGEGYHKKYGEAHAEVNCIGSVSDADKHLVGRSTLYVSLEPCAHFGKTPPCSDLIIKSNIPKVVIGSVDPFKQVDGKGIQKLQAAGVEVVTGIFGKACRELNKRFFTFHTKQRPYTILKWAQTADKKIAENDSNRLMISNNYSNRVVHKWRAEAAGILVGTNTATTDDPLLTNRLWHGKNPIRLVIDKELKLPADLKIFNNEAPTIVFNCQKNTIEPGGELNNEVYHYQVQENETMVHQISEACYKLNIQSILVEGGAKLLQSFIDEKLYDEIRVITDTNLFVQNGLSAPEFDGSHKVSRQTLENDVIEIFMKS